MAVGRDVSVKLLREGREKVLKVQLAERKEAEPEAKGPTPETDDLGIRAAELNPETARRFGIDENEKGVLVVAVKPGGKADQSGFQQGDIVKEVNRVPVQAVNQMKTEFGKSKPGDTASFLVKRGTAGFLVLKVKK
jgi:serine protease Do